MLKSTVKISSIYNTPLVYIKFKEFFTRYGVLPPSFVTEGDSTTSATGLEKKVDPGEGPGNENEEKLMDEIKK